MTQTKYKHNKYLRAMSRSLQQDLEIHFDSFTKTLDDFDGEDRKVATGIFVSIAMLKNKITREVVVV